ncbi:MULTISPECIES: SRPBCC family protein [Arachnia]|jgi:activator of hsp90 ATPase|uniref:Activator of Hsp90 ATPase homolog 1-like protein n=1 Tax=Arachnia propionica TaxID=1750 RepID=A0A3N4CZY7_9ACTN|nr:MULTISPECIES: SRPBCC family protein [Arachnia]QCT38588.1 ATPase [Arachnia propionica]QUC11814.1 SRPBCC family protein [Arachnia propionica]QUC13494.1 SRPBCC family protein [Arachnia propionica]RPA18631.1 ATPase [Arachnia propionica]VEH71054.1 Activator of Hsp90 ATPase homolog 1-like protein [Arachnia propionica]
MTSTQVHRIFIKAAPEAIWEAITKPEFTRRYFFGSSIDTTTQPGSPCVYRSTDAPLVDGEVLESDPNHRFVITWRSLYHPPSVDEPASRVTWLIEPQEGGHCCLTVIHDRLDSSPNTAKNVGAAWMFVLSGLKTVVETGESW